jgi:pyruvate dehydrogenase E2 component (dihydrolipoamide acetyltransferase)
MATSVIMPALGMGQETGTLITWLKHEGDTVTAGEPLMEVETDKAVVEVEATASGILAGVRIEEGEIVPVGEVIAMILGPGESLPSDALGGAQPAFAPTPPPLPPGGRGLAQSTAGPHVQTPTPHQQGKMLASPKARRTAAEQGIDLTSIRGSGPSGAVIAADVEATASAARREAAAMEDGRARAAPVGVASQVEPPALPRVWAVMAERMVASWTSTPHFFLRREVNVRALADERARLAAAAQEAARPTYTDLLVKATAMALRRHPNVNARWLDGRIERLTDVNVGIATATDDALFVPVIHGADTLAVEDIAAQRAELVQRATAGRLRPEDMVDGTFTVSNLGMFGVDEFVAIVNPPQAAILAVGAIKDRVIAVDGEAVVRPTMILTLSCDHRVVDGARAARFLDEIAGLLSNPTSLST